MSDIASYIRIFEASPSDDFVEKRQAAIGALADQYKKRSSHADILGLAEGLAGALAPKGKLPDALAIQIEAALKEASVVARIDEFKKEGYGIEAYYMHLPRQESATRAVQRFLNGEAEKEGTGRYVPVEVLLGNQTNEASFDSIIKKADNWAFFDNNVPKNFPPNLIARKTDVQ